MKADDRLLGSTVIAALRAHWGFTNETWRVDLADGRRVAVQRLAAPETARGRAELLTSLASRFARAGVPPLPRVVLASDGVVVTDWIEASVASELLEGEATPVHLASAAASVAIALRRVEPGGLELPAEWASAEQLAHAALGWLAAAAVSGALRRVLEPTIASLPERFAGRSPVFAHGDLNPTNVIVNATGRIVGLLDVEFARLAHPAFDACWWDWVIRFHYPTKWPALRDAFDAAGGLGASSRDDVLALQKLRALELLATASPASRSLWLQRVERTATWR